MSINYTFEALNDKEFEEFVIDLLSKKLNTDIERFKPGKDQGIDGRFFNTDNAQTIIQCKHYLKSGIKLLISDLEKKELPKIKKLNPTRYIVITSCPLSPMEKTSIKTKLSPYVLSEADIFGKENLNDLLKQYPEIETAHYKLWFTSTNVLHSLLNNALQGRSKDYLKNTILKQSKFLVQTEHYPKALQIIEEQNTIIITGSPGVGKTALANQLSLYLINEGYNFYYIDQDLKEAEEIFQESKKQLFYFDDFLGANILEALNMKNRDSKILKFIERIKNNTNKKFILTSRAHILKQQTLLNERYSQAKIDKNEYELEIAQLTDLDKAKILYNHIWHSRLPKEYIDVMYVEERYRIIIDHRNYNPRLIEFITDIERIYHINVETYWQYIQNTLDNPSDVWRQVIDIDIDEISKYILLAITLNKNEISENELQDFYSLLLKNYPNLHNGKSFKNTIEPLLNSLLKSVIKNSKTKFYTLFNPSIADYLLKNYLSEYIYLQKINLYLNSNQYSKYLSSLSFYNKITSSIYSQLVLDKLNQFIETCQPDHYQLEYLNNHWYAINTEDERIIKYLDKLSRFLLKSSRLFEHSTIFEIIFHLLEDEIIRLPNEEDKITDFINFYLQEDMEYENYNDFSKIIEIYPVNQEKNIAHFKSKLIVLLLEDEISHYIQYDGILDNIYDIDDYNPHAVQHWIINDLFQNIPFKFTDKEIAELVESIDINSIIENNKDNYDHTIDTNHLLVPPVKPNDPCIDPITDLFQRD